MASVELYLGLEHYQCSRRTKQGDKVSFLCAVYSEVWCLTVPQFTQTPTTRADRAERLQDQEF